MCDAVKTNAELRAVCAREWHLMRKVVKVVKTRVYARQGHNLTSD